MQKTAQDSSNDAAKVTATIIATRLRLEGLDSA